MGGGRKKRLRETGAPGERYLGIPVHGGLERALIFFLCQELVLKTGNRGGGLGATGERGRSGHYDRCPPGPVCIMPPGRDPWCWTDRGVKGYPVGELPRARSPEACRWDEWKTNGVSDCAGDH